MRSRRYQTISAMAAMLSLFCTAPIAIAQTVSDPVPIQGNPVTETAAGIAIRSANGGYGPVDNSPKALAQKAKVNGLISKYSDCRANARNLARDKAGKDAIREQCRRQYQPQFAKACVGGAKSIAICMKLQRKGSIE